MWRAPRKTTRHIMSMEERPSWIPVVALAGINQSLLWLLSNNASSTRNFGTAVGFALFYGVGAMIYGVLIAPFLIAILAGWFGGEGDAADVRHGIAWAFVPQAFVLIAWVPLLAAFGWRTFGSKPQPETVLQGFALLCLIPLSIAPIWSFVLEVAAVATAMQLPVWKALVTLLTLAVPSLLLAGL
jgi:hypothetical protein